MKLYYRVTIRILLITTVLIVLSGCEYGVEQSHWNEPWKIGPDPVITSVEPADVAAPGVNTITISGQNFTAAPDSNNVFFSYTQPVIGYTSLQAEIVSTSSTSITVRRPDLVTDSCDIKVFPRKNAEVKAVYKKYKIDPVVQEYGTFTGSLDFMSWVAVDKQENIYVAYGTSDTAFYKWMVKITPSGEQTRLPKRLLGGAYGATFGPDDRLYLFRNSNQIDVVDLTQNTVAPWTLITVGGKKKSVKVGDFDNAGYLYSGAKGTDLVIIAPDEAHTDTTLGVYPGTNDNITAIRVFNGYVYLVAQDAAKITSIWRHQIMGNGVLGTQELVLNWSATAYGSRVITGLTIATDGTLYIATDSPNPILIFDTTSDILYKNILNPYCKALSWGTGDYIYMICGNTSPSEQWKLYRMDPGNTGAPK